MGEGTTTRGRVAQWGARLRSDTSLRELGTGAGAAFAMRLGGKAMAYLFALVVARTLGAEAWGRFSLAFVVVNLGAILALLGLGMAVVRFVAEGRASGDGAAVRRVVRRALVVVVPSSIAVAAVAYGASPLIAESIFSKPHLAAYLQRGTLAIPPFAVLILCAEVVRGLKRVAISELLQQVLRTAFPLGVLLLLTLFWAGEVRVIDAFVVGTWALAVVALVVMGLLVRGLPAGQPAGPSASTARLLRTALPLLFAGSLIFLKSWIDTIMVGVFLSEAAVGAYDIAFKLATLLIIPLGAANTIAAPKFAELHEANDREGLQRLITYSTAGLALYAVPTTLALVVLAKPALAFFGPEYVEATSALRIICIGMLITALVGVRGVFLPMTGNQNSYLHIAIVVMAASVGMNWVLIPRFGLNGAAVATALSVSIYSLLTLVYVRYWSGSMAREAGVRARGVPSLNLEAEA